MNCDKVGWNLSAYLDEELPSRVRLAIGLHLSGCRDCRHRLEELRRMRLALLNTPERKAPEDFAAGWREAIRREDSGKLEISARRRWYLRPATLSPALACVVVIAIGTALFLHRSPLEQVKVADNAIASESASAPVASQATPAPTLEAANPAPAPKLTGPSFLGPQDEPAAEAPASVSTPATPSAPAGSFAAPPDSGVQRSVSAKMKAAGRAPADQQEKDSVFAYTLGTAEIKGAWRIWLNDTDTDPAMLASALNSAGIGLEFPEGLLLESPLLLAQVQTYEAAQEIAYRLEEEGLHVTIDLATD